MMLAKTLILIAAALPLLSAPDNYATAQRKLDQLEDGKLKPGSRLLLTNAELIAYALHKAPDGLSNPVISTSSSGIVKASAVVNFAKVQRAMGKGDSLLAGLAGDERHVAITARLTSGGGKAAFDLERVEVGGMAVEGKLLDAMVRFILLPLYPDAAVGRPFELRHGIDRLELNERGVNVIMSR